MPATPEQIREAMVGLSPEQQRQFVEELERRRGATAQTSPPGLSMLDSALASMSGTLNRTGIPADLAQEKSGQMMTAGLGGLALPSMAANPLAAIKALMMGAAGASAGGYAGRGLGQGLEYVGAPEGTSEVAGTIGGLAGGVAAPIGGPMALAKILKLGGGRAGLLGQIGERVAGSGASAAKTVAPEVARKAELDIAIKEARLAKLAADAERAKELHQVRLAKATATKPGPKAVPKPAPRTEGATALKPEPEPEFIDESAISLVAEPLPFTPRGQTKMPTVYTKGPAKPGPAPTPPEKLEETLRASLDAIAEKKASKAALEAIAEKVESSPLQVPRIQIGAQRVGRQVGMSKEQVRQQAGPVLDEARGEASPILPIEPFKNIIDTMKAIPPAQREAYVARATSGKAKWQIENIRRTLEHLGLLVPAGAAVGAMSGE